MNTRGGERGAEGRGTKTFLTERCDHKDYLVWAPDREMPVCVCGCVCVCMKKGEQTKERHKERSGK